MNIDAMLDEIEARANAKVAQVCECGNDNRYARDADDSGGWYCKRCGRSHPNPVNMSARDIPRLLAALRYCVFELTGTPGNANDENCEARIARLLRGEGGA